MRVRASLICRQSGRAGESGRPDRSARTTLHLLSGPCAEAASADVAKRPDFKGVCDPPRSGAQQFPSSRAGPRAP